MMADDTGWKGLTPQEFVSRLLIVDHSLELKLMQSQSQGLAHNLQRQLAFLGVPLVEVQVLGYRRSSSDTYEKTRAVHCAASNIATLCEDTDRWTMQGVYVLSAALNEGVETRYSSPGKWFDIPKDGGTKETDVASRHVIAIDFDVKRPSGTSATDEELARSVHVALTAWQYLSGALGGDTAMAYVHSGNGRQIHLALDALPNDKETGLLLASLLVGLDTLLSTPEVHVDRKLFDAKRILPACGTLKKKGAPDIESRPHRRTAIVTPDDPRRLSGDELRELARKIWNDTDDDGRAAMNLAFGVKQVVSSLSPPKDSPFGRVNAIPPAYVAQWLNLYDGKSVVCPGCGEKSGVAVLQRGLKCHHDRCSQKGRQGFRTNVDLVAEVRSVLPREAVTLLAEQFGLDVGVVPMPTPTPQESAPAFSSSTERIVWIRTEDIFAPLPPTRWLVPALHLVAGRPTLLAGYGFSGKTLMAQALAIALASLAPVWGKFIPNESVQVRHFDYEQGKHATLKRYQRLCIGHEIAREALGDRLQVAIFPDVYLDDKDATDVYARACDGVGVVVLDALRGATPTLDENDSTIRRCLDNLSRVSEKTGTAFLVLHHAGKTQGEDARTLPRGSSAIFDACGCVFAVSGGQNEPKEVQQTKQPAEAEGKSLETFYLLIEDVARDSSPTAGVRVLTQDATRARSASGPSAKMTLLKEAIFQLVSSTVDMRTKSSICERVTGGNKTAKMTAIDELVDEGRIAQPGGGGTGFIAVKADEKRRDSPGLTISSSPVSPASPEPVPASPTQSKQSPGASPRVPPPIGGTGTGTATIRTRTGAEEERKRSEAQLDADVLATMPAKERSQYASAQGWSDGRSKRARGALALRETTIRRDAGLLQEATDKGLDPGAWATENGWSDDRIKAAKLRMEY